MPTGPLRRTRGERAKRCPWHRPDSRVHMRNRRWVSATQGTWQNESCSLRHRKTYHLASRMAAPSTMSSTVLLGERCTAGSLTHFPRLPSSCSSVCRRRQRPRRVYEGLLGSLASVPSSCLSTWYVDSANTYGSAGCASIESADSSVDALYRLGAIACRSAPATMPIMVCSP